MAEIGGRIKEIRGALGMSQSKFSELLDTSHQTMVGKIERGECFPSIPALQIASQYGKVSVDYILTGKEWPAVATLEPLEKIKLLEEIRILSQENRMLKTPAPIKKKFQGAIGE